jgi:hypothetical protein
MTPKVGLHRNVPFDAYVQWDAANASMLKHFARSAAHARYEMTHQAETTAKLIGHAVHAAILEPENFDATFAVAPALDKRTIKGKAQWAEFEAANKDRIILRDDEMTLATALGRSVQEHPLAARLVGSPGVREASLLWHDPDIGLPCKARLDLLCMFDGYSTIVDVKTTRDASPRGFALEVARYSYHLQAAWYLRGADILSPVPRRFVFVAVEKSPPYCVALYELDTVALDAGLTTVLDCLNKYANARTSRVWPGYSSGIQTLFLPQWAMPKENYDE